MPAAAVPALTVSVDELPEVTLVGLNEAVAPVGTPLTLRFTVWAEPPVVAVLTVTVPLAFCARLRLVGLTDIEKSLGGGAPQFGSLNVPTRVLQLNEPFEGMYSFVYQNVQLSTGSTAMLV